MPVLSQCRAIEDSSMWGIRWVFRQHSTDVQTDVHIVPVDSDAQSRNLSKMPTASGENGASGETRIVFLSDLIVN